MTERMEFIINKIMLWRSVLVTRFSFDRFDSYSLTSFLLSANPISKMSHTLSIVLQVFDLVCSP